MNAQSRDDERDVLTVEQAAELLQLNWSTVRRLAQAGEIPARKVGRQWRFSRPVLLAWLAGDTPGIK